VFVPGEWSNPYDAFETPTILRANLCVQSVLPLNGILEHMIINVPVSILSYGGRLHTAANKQRKDDEEEKEDEGERKGEREAV